MTRPRNRDDTPGPLSGKDDKINRSTKYFDNKRSSEFKTNFFTFKNQKVIDGLETYSHDQSLVLLNILPTTVVDDGLYQLAEDAWKQGHVSGHMKDVDAGEEAAYYDYVEDIWTLLGQLRNEYAGVTVLDNPTFDDTTPTTSAAHRFLKPESFNTLLESLENRKFLIPVWVEKLLKMWTGIRVELMPSYEIYSTKIPAVHFVMGVRGGDLADLETLRDSMFSHKGDSVQHMNKFGIKYVPFKTEMVTGVREVAFPSPEFYNLFQILELRVYGTAATHRYGISTICDFSGGVDWSAWQALLYKGEVTKELIFSMIGDGHQAANNKYGGLFYAQLNAFEGDMNMFKYSQDDATPTIVDYVNSDIDRWLCFLNPWFGRADAAMQVEVNGTDVAAAIPMMPTSRPVISSGGLASAHFWKTNKTLGQSILESFVLREIIEMHEFS